MISISKLSQLCLLIFIFIYKIESVVTYPPIWLTSSYMQAGSFLIINSTATGNTTGSTVTPKGSITFATAFPATPNLGYGIMRY